jgi:hypothetical protein
MGGVKKTAQTAYEKKEDKQRTSTPFILVTTPTVKRQQAQPFTKSIYLIHEE